MSRIRVYVASSLDGYIAGPGDDLSWLPTDPQPEGEAIGYEAFMKDIGAMLMGRRTFDVVQGFGGEWPYGELPVLVATHRALQTPATSVRAVQGPIGELLDQALEAAGGRDVYLDGAAMVRAALQAGRVDELIVTYAPVLLGGGVELFGALDERVSLTFEGHARYGSMLQVRVRVG